MTLLGLSWRSRGALGSLWGASWGLQKPLKSLPEALPEAPRTGARFSKHFGGHFGSILGPPGPQKTWFSCGRCVIFRKNEGSEKITENTSKQKPGYHGTGSACGKSVPSTASGARTARDQRAPRKKPEQSERQEQCRKRAEQQAEQYDMHEVPRTLAYRFSRAPRAPLSGLKLERVAG